MSQMWLVAAGSKNLIRYKKQIDCQIIFMREKVKLLEMKNENNYIFYAPVRTFNDSLSK